MEILPALNEEKELAMYREPSVVLEEAKKAARALSDVIANKKKPVIINNEQYLEFEDWMTVARFYGITAKVISTSPISFGEVQGFEARAVALLVKTGEEISAAEAMCLNDESNWKNRPLFMLRSMAQTRACAKALRNVLAWVVVLAGYKPTPAEEMEGLQNQKVPVQQPKEKTNGTTPASLVFSTKIEQVGIQTGTKKDKTPWTLYIIEGQGEKFTTFSKTQGEFAKERAGKDILCDILYTKTEKGNNLTEIMEHKEPDNA